MYHYARDLTPSFSHLLSFSAFFPPFSNQATATVTAAAHYYASKGMDTTLSQDVTASVRYLFMVSFEMLVCVEHLFKTHNCFYIYLSSLQCCFLPNPDFHHLFNLLLGTNNWDYCIMPPPTSAPVQLPTTSSPTKSPAVANQLTYISNGGSNYGMCEGQLYYQSTKSCDVFN